MAVRKAGGLVAGVRFSPPRLVNKLSGNKFMNYKPTIGLEIHTELKTKTKMFCASLNNPDEKKPNVNICPICMGHPGTLPVINKEAVRKVLMCGKALGGKLADYSQFDRKNYFYPDLPKGYQISQYKFPLVEGGMLNRVKITRVHLEEDTGRLIHAEDGIFSLVDFNRAGVPLMELVTEPDINSGEQARKFAEELQIILRYLGISDADMEKGQMRIEVNISLSQISKQLGTKVEIKNLNSFRSVERAINFETERQATILDKGEKIIHETRGWDEDKQKTFSQREKEMAHDYRYFPEPDLPPLKISELGFDLSLPELPEQKRKRFKEQYGLKEEQIEIFIRDVYLGKFFESVITNLDIECPSSELGHSMSKYSTSANYITSDLSGLMKEKNTNFGDLKINPKMFANLIKMAASGEISSRGTKDVLKIMFEKGGDPEQIVEEKGLKQASDDDFIKKIVEQIIKENPAVAEDYKNGKEAALQFLVGQGMKLSGGKANPEMLKKYLKEK